METRCCQRNSRRRCGIAGRDVSVAYGAFAKKMGVDTSELYVVDALWDEPEGLSQRSICEVCDMGKQTSSAICKRLRQRDVVVAHASQADKRERIMVPYR